MNEQTELECALEVLREIATGDNEREAFVVVEHAVGAYRSLYEDAEKRLMRFRDIAAKPDICIPVLNKDRFSEIKAALMEYTDFEPMEGKEKPTFEDWLFLPVRKEAEK